MSDHEHAQLLLNMAHNDLSALKGMQDPGIFKDVIFGFHAPQVVEKGLKALLSSREVVYPRTHDLEELYKLVIAKEPKFPGKYLSLCDLTDFAVQFRYEPYEELTGLDRRATIRLLDDFINCIAYRI